MTEEAHMKIKLFSYDRCDTWIHRLSGLTRLVCFLLLTTAVMILYDIRFFAGITVLSYVLMRMAKIRFERVKLMFYYVGAFLAVNFFLTFLFAPEYGVELFGTRHVLLVVTQRYTVTAEQLFYQISQCVKYVSVIPLGMIFILTTNPSEFASSLNRIGISYRVCTILSLTLRYFPDVARDYRTIAIAQQARGLDLSHRASLKKRIKDASAILLPLIFSTMDRIEVISNAMDLRGYGKKKTRTWYTAEPLHGNDYASMLICVLIFILSVYIRLYINHGMFYNPFK